MFAKRFSNPSDSLRNSLKTRMVYLILVPDENSTSGDNECLFIGLLLETQRT